MLIDGDFFCDGEILVSGDVTIASGSIDLANSTWQIEGNLSIEDAVNFLPNALSGSSFAIAGDFEAIGSELGQLNLAPNTPWTITVQGSALASYCDVRFSDASGGVQIVANDGTNEDLGNNLNWLFAVQASLEKAIIARFEDALPHLPVYGQRLSRKASYPAATISRLSSTFEEVCGSNVTVREGFFNIQVWSDNPTSLLTTVNQVKAAFHNQQGEWGDTTILHSVVENIYDGPAENEGNHIYYRKVLAVRIKYRYFAPLLPTAVDLASPDIYLAIINYLKYRIEATVELYALKRGGYPLIQLEQRIWNNELVLGDTVNLEYLSFWVHVYGRDWGEVCELTDEVVNSFDYFSGTLGTLHTKTSVLDASDYPIEAGPDLEHLSKFHRVVEIAVWHD